VDILESAVLDAGASMLLRRDTIEHLNLQPRYSADGSVVEYAGGVTANGSTFI
jgi:hypothetical protein